MGLRFDELVRSESDVSVKLPPKLSGEDAVLPDKPKSAITKKDDEIPVNFEAYDAAGEKRYDHSDKAVEKTFATYGFTKAMIANAKKTLTSEICHVFSLLDNSSDMGKGDGSRIEANSSMGAVVTGLDLQELLAKEANGEGPKRRNSKIGGYALGEDAIDDATVEEAKTDPVAARKARETAAKSIGVRTERCTRWDELAEETRFQIEVAAMMKKPTEFQLISIPSKGVSRKFGVATDEGDDDCFIETAPAAGDVEVAKRGRKSMSTGRNTVFAGGGNFALSLDEEAGLARDAIDDLNGNLKGLPRSITGLLKEIKKTLEEFKSMLEPIGKKVIVSIITASYPWGSSAVSVKGGDAKQEFLDFVKTFQDLPVTFVFSIKSPNKDVQNFYETLVTHGKSHGVDIHASKGFDKMSSGVSVHNGWLNYCSPIHLSQLLGGNHQHLLFDASCRELTLVEAGELCRALLGDSLTDPTKNGLDVFVAALRSAVKDEPVQWNSKARKTIPIIDADKFKDAYSGGGSKKKPVAKPVQQTTPSASASISKGPPKKEKKKLFCFGRLFGKKK